MSDKRPLIRIVWPRFTPHGSEIFLLWSISIGLLGYMGFADAHGNKVDLAACLVVLTGIISALKERWTQRSVDQMGEHLGQSQPTGDGPLPVNVTNKASNPIPTQDAGPRPVDPEGEL